MDNKRNPILDIMKGITIILMMLGHTGIPEWLHTFIYSFHMPLFFILSGYFAKFNESISWNGWKDELCKNAKSLLVPYVFTAFIVLLFTALRAFVAQDITIFTDRLVACLVSTNGVLYFPQSWTWVSPEVNLSWAPVWFLLSLFFVRIIFYGLQMCKKWALPISIIISYIAVIIGRQTMIPFALMQGLSGLVFYVVGWYYRYYSIHKYLLWLCVLSWPLAIIYGGINMMFLGYSIYPLSITGAVGGTIVIYYISSLINRISKISDLFCWLGRSSLLILCLHSIDLNCVWVNMLINGALHLNVDVLWITIIRNIMVFVFAVMLSNVSYIRRIFNLK